MIKQSYEAPRTDKIVLQPEQCILGLSDPANNGNAGGEDAQLEFGSW